MEEESTEIREFINFSIREYVAEIRKKYPKKCWPFGSLGDPDTYAVFSSCHSLKSTFLSAKIKDSDLNESLGTGSKMGKIVDNGSAELTSCKVNNGQNRNENNVVEGAKIGHNVAAYGDEPVLTRPQTKPRKFRLLSDIYKDPASELRERCPENVNRRFLTEIDDDDDDDDYDNVTLGSYFRIQKGVDLRLRKKGNVTGVDQDKKSKHGSRDKDFQLECSPNSYKEATEKEKENEDSEMVAVMLLAQRFIEEKRIPRELETNQSCACVKKNICERSTRSPVMNSSSKAARKHLVLNITKENVEKALCSGQRRTVTPVCAFNLNPADFSTPSAENKFMR